MASDKLNNTTDSDFKRDVLDASNDTPVLVDFWAPWCGPCRAMTPLLEAVSDELGGKVKIVKVNVDDNPKIATEHGVINIPLLLMFKGGKVVDKVVGNPGTKAKLQAFIQKSL